MCPRKNGGTFKNDIGFDKNLKSVLIHFIAEHFLDAGDPDA